LGNCSIVSGCRFDFITVHVYNSVPSCGELLGSTFILPVWITEFACVEHLGANTTSGQELWIALSDMDAAGSNGHDPFLFFSFSFSFFFMIIHL